jgi:hypothetical protein
VAESEPAGPTPDELLEAIRKMKVSDLLLSTVSTVAQLGYAKLEEGARDLEQARLAVESMRALIPVLADAVPEEATKELNQVVADLQLAYAKAAENPDPEGSS